MSNAPSADDAATKLLQELKRLEAEREALERQRLALENQIWGLRRALELIGGASSASEAVGRAPGSGITQPRQPRQRRPIRDLVLDIIRNGDPEGMTARTIVEAAQARGIDLDRNSVSSLLSRLKRDNVLTFDGRLYQLSKDHQAISDGVFSLTRNSDAT